MADDKHEAFSHGWAQALCATLHADPGYRVAAARWEGAILLRVDADPDQGFAEDRAVFLDLHRGECRGARAARPADFDHASFVLSGGATAWREVLAGRLEPVAAATRGKLRLDRGSLIRLLPHAESARRLLAAARRIDTAWP
jgi:putative sterol carrier protein